MLKIEKFAVPSPEQWEMIIEGTRNPMNSWNRMDSQIINATLVNEEVCPGVDSLVYKRCEPYMSIGPNDHDLLMRLAKGGPVHAKYRRMIPVWVTLTAPLYMLKELDTYKVGTVCNSSSTMHKIHANEFTLDDFSTEHMTPMSLAHIKSTINILNIYRNTYLYGGDDILEDGTKIHYELKDKEMWYQMIQLLPTSYNQRRTYFLNYEVLKNIYESRKDHKLTDWHTFCDWITELPYSELITGEVDDNG